MKGWLYRWALSVLAWAGCAMALGAIIAGGHPSRWITALWVIATALWVTTARLKDRTIRTQQDTIRVLRTHRDLLMQKQKAGWS